MTYGKQDTSASIVQYVPLYELSLSTLQGFLDGKSGPNTYSVILLTDRYQIILPPGKEKLTDTEIDELREKRTGNRFMREDSEELQAN